MVLDETEDCHPLVLEVNELVVAQIRRLSLSHLVTSSSLETPLAGEGGSGKRPATPDNMETAGHGLPRRQAFRGVCLKILKPTPLSVTQAYRSGQIWLARLVGSRIFQDACTNCYMEGVVGLQPIFGSDYRGAE